MENSTLGNPSTTLGAKKEVRFTVIGLFLGLIILTYVALSLNFISTKIRLINDKSLISQPNFVKFKLQEAKGL